MRFSKSVPLSIAMLLLYPTITQAWLRAPVEDATLVERSEIIVVGRLLKDSVEYVPHMKGSIKTGTSEHHARLAITEVIKGTCEDKEIPIIIHYGLCPVVGGHVSRDSFGLDARFGRSDYPKDKMEVFDTASKSVTPIPLDGAVTDDNLWFLRRRSGFYGREPGTGNFGIVDPQDLQPLHLKEYFLCYFSEDPELAVKKYMSKDPSVAKRAQRFLDHLEIQRILQLTDPAEKFDKLWPYYLKRMRWNMTSEVKDGILSCGEIAGDNLMNFFQDSEYARLRDDIILMWGDIGYQKAVPVLIDLLEQHDKFWQIQDLKKDWWNTDINSEITRERRKLYGEVHHAVYALRVLGDPRAKEAIELTRKRWETIDFENPQIVEECDTAVRKFAEQQ
ncbi:MAG: hypothetical protein ABIH23_27300 [bacterium]